LEVLAVGSTRLGSRESPPLTDPVDDGSCGSRPENPLYNEHGHAKISLLKKQNQCIAPRNEMLVPKLEKTSGLNFDKFMLILMTFIGYN
jgi:hypothetical protein